MPKHKLAQGESSNSLAWEKRTTYHILWNHAENAELKAKRGDPNTLRPGDEIFYPDKEEKEEGRADAARHPFRVPGIPFRLRIRILNANRKPMKDADWELDLDGTRTGIKKTDAEGWLEHKIGPEVSSATLFINGVEVPLKLRHLDPANTVYGLQQRLANLAYPVGPIDGIMGQKTEGAIRRFQEDFADEGMVVNGLMDEATIKALRKVHEDAALTGLPNQLEPGESVPVPTQKPVRGSDDDDAEGDDEGDDGDEAEDDGPVEDYRSEMALGQDAGRAMPNACLQLMLAYFGYEVGPIDGIVGSKTTAAIRAFQTDHQLVHRLDVDGIAGPLTRTALRKEYADA